MKVNSYSFKLLIIIVNISTINAFYFYVNDMHSDRVVEI